MLSRAGRVSRSLFGENVPAQHLISLRCFQGQPIELQNAGEASCTDDAVLHRYRELLSRGTLRPDEQQAAVAGRLNELCNSLVRYSAEAEQYTQVSAQYREARRAMREQLAAVRQQERDQEPEPGQQGMWASFRARLMGLQPDAGSVSATRAKDDMERRLEAQLGPHPVPPPPPRGLYIWGSVGSGKSMLMDLFYSSVTGMGLMPLARRLHFNSALVEVHSNLAALERARREREARQAADYARLLETLPARPPAPLPDAEGRVEEYRTPLSILRRDPGVQRQRRAHLARLAVRREQRDRMSRSPQQNASRMANSNAQILQRAAAALMTGRPAVLATANSGGGDGGAGLAVAPPMLRPGTAGLLCFDELQVGDAFNAVALKGVLEPILDSGGVLVSTSNKPPWELNRQGIQEDLFEHFVEHLLSHCDVQELSAPSDYRRMAVPRRTGAETGAGVPAATAIGSGPHLIHPLGPEAGDKLEQRWQDMAAQQHQVEGGGNSGEGACTLPVAFGRTLEVPRSCGGAAFFTFDELCNRFVGAADYMALAQRYHTLFLADVPAMSLRVRDQARRFILLVDELYNHRCLLVASCEVEADLLFAGAEGEEPIIDLEGLQFEGAVEGSKLRRNLMADGGVAPVGGTTKSLAAAQAQLGGQEEKFMFARAVSRLHEMGSQMYYESRPRT